MGGRLPSESEWTWFACSGDATRPYPWGHERPRSSLANYGYYVGGTTPVGSYPATDWGLVDGAGNVEEWCADVPPKESPEQFDRIGTGGCWNKGEEFLLCHNTRHKWYRVGTVGIGFRIVWEA